MHKLFLTLLLHLCQLFWMPHTTTHPAVQPSNQPSSHPSIHPLYNHLIRGGGWWYSSKHSKSLKARNLVSWTARCSSHASIDHYGQWFKTSQSIWTVTDFKSTQSIGQDMFCMVITKESDVSPTMTRFIISHISIWLWLTGLSRPGISPETM